MRILLLALLPFAICACKQQTDTAFTESDKIITNPGQGFASCTQNPRTDGILPYGVGYGRYDWSDFEPEDGKYDWSKIDKAISWGEKNKIPAHTTKAAAATAKIRSAKTRFFRFAFAFSVSETE